MKIKKCTSSACRRSFSLRSMSYHGRCPWCGKQYPRIPCRLRLLLTGYGKEKIRVIKAVRDATGLGLALCKQLVESASPESPYVFTEQMLRPGYEFRTLEAALLKAGASCRWG